jgi:hypothetical protein
MFGLFKRSKTLRCIELCIFTTINGVKRNSDLNRAGAGSLYVRGIFVKKKINVSLSSSEEKSKLPFSYKESVHPPVHLGSCSNRYRLVKLYKLGLLHVQLLARGLYGTRTEHKAFRDKLLGRSIPSL